MTSVSIVVTERRRDAQGATSELSTRCVLELSPTLLSFTQPQGERVWLDFAAHRHVVSDPAGGTCTHQSLFASPYFRSIEGPNRAHIASVLEAGGADASMFHPVIVEHQLSMRDVRSSTKLRRAQNAGNLLSRLSSAFESKSAMSIEVATSANTTSYRWRDAPLCEVSLSGVPCSPAVLRAFVQYLRWAFGGHPLVLDDVLQNGTLPRSLTLFTLAIGEVYEVQLQIESVGHTAATAIEIPPEREAQDNTMALLRERAETALAARSNDQAARLSAATEAVRSGDALQGVLDFFMLTLESVVAMPPALAEALNACRDARVSALLSAMSPQSGPEAEQAIVTFEALRHGPPPNDHPALLCLEAAILKNLGDVRSAESLYVTAINANPLLTGAYHDLGDLALGKYDTGTAWRLWAIARKIAPEHRILGTVAEHEARMLKQYPEYFQ
ncbi:MAG: hypothetical protein Q8Q09_00720 [Deltaproteobacteria bacterium]|nr:hypothetical protein [Deltaproteobacteria bacterium]